MIRWRCIISNGTIRRRRRRSPRLSSLSRRRCFASSSSSDEKPPPKKNTKDDDQDKKIITNHKSAAISILQDEVPRSVGQVIFLNSSFAGGIILLSLAAAAGGGTAGVNLAMMGGLSSLASCVTSHVVLGSSQDNSQGLLAYNGCLVGCAASTFFPSSAAAAAAMTLVGAPASTFATVALQSVFTKQPQWTYAFNAVTLTILLGSQKASFLPSVATSPVVAEAVAAAATDSSASSSSIPLMDLLATTPLKGLSQIFLADSSLSGFGILVGIASYSPQLAVHAIIGSTIGTLTGYASSFFFSDASTIITTATAENITIGLWGYNSALTSMAVGFVCVPSRQSWMMSAGGACAAAICYGAMSSHVLSPCLTLPFCFTASACYPLISSGLMPGLQLAGEPHSPERNHINNNKDSSSSSSSSTKNGEEE